MMTVRPDKQFAIVGMAHEFDVGATQYLSNGAGGAPVIAAPFAWSCWVKPRTAVGANQAFVSITDTTYDGDWWALGADASDIFRHQARDDYVSQTADSGVTYTPGVWYHLMGAERYSNSRFCAVNGRFIGISTSSSSPDSSNNVSIGRISDSSPGHYADAVISNVAIWNARLAQTDAMLAYRAGSPLNFAKYRHALVSYWPLTEKTGGRDVVGGYHLTAYNGPTLSGTGSIQRAVWQVQKIFPFVTGSAPPATKIPVIMRHYKNMRM